jgi:hypothetical protein
VGDGLAARVPEPPRLWGWEQRFDQRPEFVVQDRLGHVRASMHLLTGVLPAILFIGTPSCRSPLSERCSYYVGVLSAVYGLRLTCAFTRLRRNLCLSCGYDLSSLTLGAVCPECGSKIK